MKKTLLGSLLIVAAGIIVYIGVYQVIRTSVSAPEAEDVQIIEEAEIEEQKSINVSGRLHYSSATPEGYYTVWWMSTPKIHSIEDLITSEDGYFSVDFPENSGELNLITGYEENPDRSIPAIAAAEVPVEIGTSDIDLGLIELSELEEDIRYMDTFSGETVTMQGEIVMSDFTYGVFDITLASREAWERNSKTPEADIDYIGPIREPGVFKVELPRGFGEVFVMVTYFPFEDEETIGNRSGIMPEVVRSYYSGNPVIAADEDIRGIRVEFP